MLVDICDLLYNNLESFIVREENLCNIEEPCISESTLSKLHQLEEVLGVPIDPNCNISIKDMNIIEECMSEYKKTYCTLETLQNSLNRYYDVTESEKNDLVSQKIKLESSNQGDLRLKVIDTDLSNRNLELIYVANEMKSVFNKKSLLRVQLYKTFYGLFTQHIKGTKSEVDFTNEFKNTISSNISKELADERTSSLYINLLDVTKETNDFASKVTEDHKTKISEKISHPIAH